MKKLFLILAFILAGISLSGPLGAGESVHKPVVYFFWGEGCPHCHHEKIFWEELKGRLSGFVVRDYEVWNDPQNKEIYRRLAAAFGQESGSVPATFIGRKVWIGFSPQKAGEIEKAVRECLVSGCVDPAGLIGSSAVPVSPSEDPAPETVPFLGEVDPARISLPLLTVVLAGLDGFNPCAFFVLLMLLSLMVHARSRLRMLIVGGVFVFFSGAVYFLFMAAWLNLFMVTGHVRVITVLAGVLACAMAAINIKDYFFFKKGVSLTLSDEARDSLLERMRRLIRTGSLGGLVAGTIVLAVLANTYELLCTAGFPMVFTRALTLQELSVGAYYFYLLLYNVIYVVPLLVIVLIFVRTLGARKLTEEEGRILKLVSGLMMLGLGSVLLLRPELLNNILFSVGLVGGVIVLTAGIVVIGRRGA
ncbi:MAG: thioredoxin family protein [Elusimicrobia bacterium]|nr:thioredoxin family protein [Elusimicrobiota bacterium]